MKCDPVSLYFTPGLHSASPSRPYPQLSSRHITLRRFFLNCINARNTSAQIIPWSYITGGGYLAIGTTYDAFLLDNISFEFDGPGLFSGDPSVFHLSFKKDESVLDLA